MGYTILEQVKLKLRQFHTEIDESTSTKKIVFDESDDDYIINQLITEAECDVAAARNYPDDYTDEQIAVDLKNQQNIIVKLVMYDFVKEGSEFQESYNVNQSSATYVSRDSILANVTPFVHLL